MPRGLLTYYGLEFHRADDPPPANMLVFCTDGVSKIGMGFWIPGRCPPERDPWFGIWFSKDPDHLAGPPEHMPWVKGWAYMPDLGECIADCYPDRACCVCGCTQDKSCEGGCSWAEWDLCSKCKARIEADAHR
jgi:hypothetical protein